MIAEYKWILEERRPMTARPIPDAPPVTNAVRATNDEEGEGEVGEDMTAAGNRVYVQKPILLAVRLSFPRGD